MNTLKFRIWDDGPIFHTRRFWFSEKTGLQRFFTWVGQHPGTEKNIQQFTGVRDKNRKEIYEGDIVKCEWKQKGDFITAEIRFGSGGFYLYHYDFLCFCAKNETLEDGEVIGNIFQNPELIK